MPPFGQVAFPGALAGDFSTAKGDGSAVRASDTTITWVGPTITTPQIKYVVVVSPDLPNGFRVYQQYNNNVLITIAAGVITIANSGVLAPVPASTTAIEVIWVAQNKAFDSGINSNRGFQVNPLWGQRQTTPTPILTAAQDFTAAFVALGPVITTDGFTRISLWLNVDINNTVSAQIRLRAQHTLGGSLFLLPILKPDTTIAGSWKILAEGEVIQLDNNADQLIVLTWDVSNSVPFVQPEIFAAVPGAPAGQILVASSAYTLGWGS